MGSENVQMLILRYSHCAYSYNQYISQQMRIKGKGKSVPLQAWSGPESSRNLRFLDFMTTVQGGGKVVSHTHWLHLCPENSPGTHFY